MSVPAAAAAAMVVVVAASSMTALHPTSPGSGVARKVIVWIDDL